MDFNEVEKVQEINFNGELHSILVVNNGERTYIPLIADNTDYQAYLKWLAEGNTPEAATAATLPAENA